MVSKYIIHYLQKPLRLQSIMNSALNVQKHRDTVSTYYVFIDSAAHVPLAEHNELNRTYAGLFLSSPLQSTLIRSTTSISPYRIDCPALVFEIRMAGGDVIRVSFTFALTSMSSPPPRTKSR